MKLAHDMLTHGVNIVCAQHEGKRGGLAVAWATQVGTDHVLICVGAQSYTRELILGSGAFGLSVLRADQLEVARWFGTQSSHHVDKLAQVAYHLGETGSPLLDDCAVNLDCRVVEVHDFRREKLIIGQVVGARLAEEPFEPLIYRSKDY
ncbi:MAG: flavin reductase [Chloroflexi bacterium]|nr:flavin reductase [Chloroflexota bacterium]